MKTLKDTGPRGKTLAPEASPWMTFEEGAAYLGLTVQALRRALDRPEDPLGLALRPMLILLSERRRYIKRRAFMQWQESKAS